MTMGFRAACLLACLSMPGAALSAPRPAPAPSPATPEPGWTLARGKDALNLSYGMPNGADTIIAFACVPRSGDVTIRLPKVPGKATVDQSQPVSLTIGGVKSSFAGTVIEDQDGEMMLQVTVPSRTPMFTALAGPGGMRIESKGFNKIVPLRGIGEKLRQFLAGCRKG
jgi:hypothetical protein